MRRRMLSQVAIARRGRDDRPRYPLNIKTRFLPTCPSSTQTPLDHYRAVEQISAPPPRPPPARPRPRNDSRKAAPMSTSRKIAHKAEAVKGAFKKTAAGSPAAGACAPKAPLTRQRATSNRPGPRSKTP